MYSFENIELKNINRKEFYNFPQKSVFTTIPWINYLLEDTDNSELILLRITKEHRFVGYFTGMRVKKFGVGIVGSPFRGWSTCYMGLDILDDDERSDVLLELKAFIFKHYKCNFIQIIDRELNPQEGKRIADSITTVDTYELDINKSDEELFRVFKTDCRNFIRQFERRGATIEVAKPDDIFAEEFYNQLTDVFSKQGMVPTYSLDKVKRLIKNLHIEDMVLCLRVRDPEGNSIATSIFPGYNGKCFFWGGASYRTGQSYRPNEYMIWSAIRYWRERGFHMMDMMGCRDYKKKFGPQRVSYFQVEYSRPKILIYAKNLAEKAYFAKLSIKHKFKQE